MRAECQLGVGRTDRPKRSQHEARVGSNVRQVTIVGKHMHAPAKLTGERLRVGKRAGANRGLADMRHDQTD
jgi:hypothetical protein